VQAEDEGREEKERRMDGDCALVRRGYREKIDQDKAQKQPFDFRDGSGKAFSSSCSMVKPMLVFVSMGTRSRIRARCSWYRYGPWMPRRDEARLNGFRDQCQSGMPPNVTESSGKNAPRHVAGAANVGPIASPIRRITSRS
jgi:hypothetical protein